MNAVFVGLALVCFASGEYQNTTPPMFVAETRSNYSVEDGVLELGGGRGWLRTPRLYLDFRIAFEYRTTSPDADGGLMVRTWTGKGGWPERGYRFRLPVDPLHETSSMFVARKEKLAVVQEGRVSLRPLGEWQQIEVTGHGRTITVVLNGTLAGVVEVEKFGGHILLDNTRGRIQFRNFAISQPSDYPESPANLARPTKQFQEAGGHPPKLLREVKPSYTPEAVLRRIEGVVRLEVVVLADGSTGPARITDSLDPDLDLSAVSALKEWKFTPAVMHGTPVPTLVEVEMLFRLK